MHSFSYTRPVDVHKAVDELTSPAVTKLIRGGTNLIGLMKLNVEQPRRLVGIDQLPFDTIAELPTGGLRLGALARCHRQRHVSRHRQAPLRSTHSPRQGF